MKSTVKSKNRIRQSKGDYVFDVINYILLVLILIIFVYPTLFLIVASFSDPVDMASGRNLCLIPRKVVWDGYIAVFQNNSIWNGYLNTIIYTVVGTLFNLALTITGAYPLSRKDFKARNLLTAIYMVTMYFGGGLIPTYFLVKDLHLINNPLIMIIIGGVSVYNLIVVRTFFQNNIPDEILEAAKIDGCKDLTFFWKIVLPLSKSIIAVMALFYAVSHWNDYFNAMIYLNDQDYYPLQLILRDILLKNEIQKSMLLSGQMVGNASETQRTGELIKYVVIIVSTLPVMVVYPLVQKYFVQGVMIGSVKG